MQKFDSCYAHLLSASIAQLAQFVAPPDTVEECDLRRAHCSSYLSNLRHGRLDPKIERATGLPWSEQLVKRTFSEVSGTLLTARLALQHGLACSTAGGTHHAFRDRGSGYCVVNDLAVTSLALLASKEAERVLIVDLDVHQGDGTAAILAHEPRTFTYSVHCQANFPARKQKSDMDIGLPKGTSDKEFLRAVSTSLPSILRSFRPDLVLYDAGVDPHKVSAIPIEARMRDDLLGHFELTDEGLYRREMLVMDTCLAMGIPVAGVVGGGYDDVARLGARHSILHAAANELWSDYRLSR
eukprot:scaffold5295_cov390-Prasinococcus_capsulatus_cf.AAC.4